MELNDERLLLGALQFEERDVRSVLLPLETVRTLRRRSPRAGGGRDRAGLLPVPGALRGRGSHGVPAHQDVLETDPARRDLPVGSGVVRELPTLRAGDSLRSALAVMQRTSAHLAVVVDDGTPGSGRSRGTRTDVRCAVAWRGGALGAGGPRRRARGAGRGDPGRQPPGRRSLTRSAGAGRAGSVHGSLPAPASRRGRAVWRGSRPGRGLWSTSPVAGVPPGVVSRRLWTQSGVRRCSRVFV
ncbi:hypothetical protein NKG05_27985 [Oerskovia sp. M15]